MRHIRDETKGELASAVLWAIICAFWFVGIVEFTVWVKSPFLVSMLLMLPPMIFWAVLVMYFFGSKK